MPRWVCSCPASHTNSITPTGYSRQRRTHRTDTGRAGRRHRVIALVKAQSDRANDIIRSLSRFSWHRTGAPEAVDLHDVISEVLQLRRAELDSRGIAVDLESSAAGASSREFAELEQVVLNSSSTHNRRSSGRPNGGRISDPAARHAPHDSARGHRTMGLACRRNTRRNCFSRSSRPSRSG